MANYQAGFQAKIRVNSTAYAGASYRIADECQEQDVSNTEGIAGNPAAPSNTVGYSGYIGGLRRFTADIRNATFDVLSNPFLAPFSLAASSYIALRVFLNGSSGVSWQSNSFFVNRIGTDGEIRGLQPISFSGLGDGFYSVPSA